MIFSISPCYISLYFKLKIISVFLVDAYDSFYNITGEIDEHQRDLILNGKWKLPNNLDENSKVVCFSTCTEMMSDERLVVVAEMKNDPDYNKDGSSVRKIKKLPWWEYLYRLIFE